MGKWTKPKDILQDGAISALASKPSFQWVEVAPIIGAVGTETDVSSLMTGKIPNGDEDTIGVVTTAPHNYVQMIDNNSKEPFKNSSGLEVFGRLNYESDSWILRYYVLESGIEVAHNFTAPVDIQWIFKEVFEFSDLPTFSSVEGAFLLRHQLF